MSATTTALAVWAPQAALNTYPARRRGAEIDGQGARWPHRRRLCYCFDGR